MDRYFWEALGDFGDSVALMDEVDGETWSYRRVKDAVDAGRTTLISGRRKLIFLCASNDAGSVLCYLSALAAGHPVHLAKPASWPDANALLERYRPDILLWKGDNGPIPPQYEISGELFGYQRADYRGNQETIGGGIGLLLSTSGSMGSPKLVRLSRDNLAAAAHQVAQALRLCPAQRAVTALPLHFVYGLSVIHAHLHAGASIVLTGRSVQDKAFWRLLADTDVTNLAGVPWTFRMMKAISFDPASCPSLRNLAASGGPLEPQLLAWLKGLAAAGFNIFSMYGQTEATGRMCVLPPELFPSKPNSVGLPVEGASVNCGVDGAIMFRGPNVMLGYSAGRVDLTGADDRKGVLSTGDVGHLDGDGHLHVTGRMSRVAKLLGLRIHLDEMEALLGGGSCVAADSDDHALIIFVEKTRPHGLDIRLKALLDRLGVPAHCARIHVLEEFPRNEAGKIRYTELPKMKVLAGKAG